jgi:hypothetical protein
MTTEELNAIRIARDARFGSGELSRLDKFACAALTGLLANPLNSDSSPAQDADDAFEIAVAMFAESRRRAEPS